MIEMPLDPEYVSYGSKDPDVECATCGWEGYEGQMQISDDGEYEYCPQCASQDLQDWGDK